MCTVSVIIPTYNRSNLVKEAIESVLQQTYTDFEVLQGLSQPINTISLEFIPERIELSLRCIDYLDKLGIAKFNYCIGDSMSFALPSWVNFNQMKTALIQMDK